MKEQINKCSQEDERFQNRARRRKETSKCSLGPPLLGIRRFES